MGQENDPRVYFAAERTLLAWVRTGLTVMGLGFVVAHFGLFLSVIRQAKAGETVSSSQHGSTVIGVALIILGAAAMAMSARQHDRFRQSLEPRNCREHTKPVGRFASPSSCRSSVWLGGYLMMRSSAAY